MHGLAQHPERVGFGNYAAEAIFFEVGHYGVMEITAGDDRFYPGLDLAQHDHRFLALTRR